MTSRTLYIDESGDHDLRRIDPSYPIFVLGGIIVDDIYQPEMVKELDRLKNRWFGTTEVVLHTADIVRNKKQFSRFIDAELRSRFFEELSELFADLKVDVLACAINKPLHRAQHGPFVRDPYMYALMILVERFCLDLGDVRHGGRIIAERRSKILDRDFTQAWADLRTRGTTLVTSRTIAHRISSCDLEAKSNNVAGLQIADLVVSPIGRHLIKKTNTGILDYRSTIYEKFIKDECGDAIGYGLVVLPNPPKKV